MVDGKKNPSKPGSRAACLGGKYLTFDLGKEEFGIGILQVREIIGMMSIRPLPRVPDFIKGVINLRDKVIPVIDLRLRFGMEPAAYDERTCIIVVETHDSEGDIPMGLVVDAVNEVTNIKTEQMESTPSFGVALDTAYILGMAKSEGRVKVLLDIDCVLGVDDLESLRNVA